MIKRVGLSVCLLFALLQVACSRPSEAGRFQIIPLNGMTFAFLDTVTGTAHICSGQTEVNSENARIYRKDACAALIEFDKLPDVDQ